MEERIINLGKPIDKPLILSVRGSFIEGEPDVNLPDDFVIDNIELKEGTILDLLFYFNHDNDILNTLKDKILTLK